MRTAVPALLLILAACSGEGGEGGAAAPEAVDEEKDLPPRPAEINGEPAVVTVKHVLVSFAGTRTAATRSRDDAERLAYDIVGWAKEGRDFEALVQEHSDDPGKAPYTLVNEGVERRGDEIERGTFVKGFTQVAFRLKVGEIGISMYHPDDSPFGYHVIKRVK